MSAEKKGWFNWFGSNETDKDRAMNGIATALEAVKLKVQQDMEKGELPPYIQELIMTFENLPAELLEGDKEKETKSGQKIPAKKTKADLTQAIEEALPSIIYQSLTGGLHDFAVENSRNASQAKKDVNDISVSDKVQAYKESVVENQKASADEALEKSAQRAQNIKAENIDIKKKAGAEAINEFVNHHEKQQKALDKHFRFVSEEEKESSQATLEEAAAIAITEQGIALEASQNRALHLKREAAEIAEANKENNAKKAKELLQTRLEEEIEKSTKQAEEKNNQRYQAEDKEIRQQEYEKAIRKITAEKSYGKPLADETIEAFAKEAEKRIELKNQGRDFSWNQQQQGIVERVTGRLEREARKELQEEFPETLTDPKEVVKTIETHNSKPVDVNKDFEEKKSILAKQAFLNPVLNVPKKDETQEQRPSEKRVADYQKSLKTVEITKKINHIEGALQGKYGQYQSEQHPDVKNWESQFSNSKDRFESGKSNLSELFGARRSPEDSKVQKYLKSNDSSANALSV